MATVAKTNLTVAKPVESGATQVVYKKHHILVRLTHWLNIVALLGLGVTGISIYWASPIYLHAADPVTGNQDYLQDLGIWLTKHLPGQKHYDDPPSWFYNHFSLGTGALAEGLRLHWAFAYLFMLIGVFYLVGLFIGGGYKSLIPRPSDIPGAFKMIRYYLGLPIAKITKKPWPHPHFDSKYNSLQRLAYASMPVAGTLAVATGWVLHKPAQLGWLQAIFHGYDCARIWHFWIMWYFAAFVFPHVILVIADGFDTFRSMITGWSVKTWEMKDGK